ncbi:hypothetical protein [Nonomuraea sp. NPDC049480]|uniref:hypothetical protein n=1 Tax=Nonomuraea sp. NPDC049480 TaxID=3364353 RepID=UPI0037B19B06
MSRRWIPAALMLAALALLTGCATEAVTASSTAQGPAKVEKLAGAEQSKVTITDKAAQRLGIQLGTVQAAPGNLLVVPYSAVVYDTKGQAWTFTNPQKGVYLRHKVTVDSVRDATALLSAGPANGTAVVTVGSAELYGAELGIGK